jgi:hypothetical protein
MSNQFHHNRALAYLYRHHCAGPFSRSVSKKGGRGGENQVKVSGEFTQTVQNMIKDLSLEEE